jgi:hypothetical protein
MNFDCLDDSQPPKGDVNSVRGAARRRQARRLAGGGALGIVVVVGVVIVAAGGGDDGIDVGPAEPSTTVAARVGGVSWSDNGLDFRFSLEHTQAVVGGEVRATLEVTNPSAEPVEVRQLCGREPFALEVRLDGTPMGDYEYPMCLQHRSIAPGNESFLISTKVGDLGETRDRRYDIVLAGLDDSVSIPIEVVESRGSSELIVDEALQEVTLVVHNDTDALVPFPGPGEICPDLHVQSQFVTPGAEPEPFAWPGVDCEPKPVLQLEPGRNEVVTSPIEAPSTPGAYELVGDIGYAWDQGITPPPRLGVTTP